jgi:hypothetical protein
MSPQVSPRRKPGVVFGITHDIDGTPIVREPKMLKVGIGCPKGPAIDVVIHQGKWFVRMGYENNKVTSLPCKDRAHAEARYFELKPQAPHCPYPRKLSYFTFTHQVADGTFEPDFEAIEAYGERPGAIDLVFFDDNPLDASYQFWGASELKCKGDGINAERVFSMATEQQRELVMQASAMGSKYFPIVEGCCVRGCDHAKEQQRGNKVYPADCKPHADLKFQLAKNLRIGGTAYFHTTGRRSITQLFSCLHRFKIITGGGNSAAGFLVGIPFKMVLKPFRTNHNGQPGTAYGVSLEFRADTVEDLLQSMMEQGMRFRKAMGVSIAGAAPLPSAPPRMLEAGDSPADIVDPGDEELTAQALNDEFTGEPVILDGDEGGPKQETMRSSLSLDQFKPASEPNRGHDATTPQPETKAQQTAPAETTAQQDKPSPTSNEPPVDLPNLGEWPENLDQEWYQIKGVLYRWNEEAGSYHEVKILAKPPAPAPAAAPASAKPSRRRNPAAFDFDGGGMKQ